MILSILEPRLENWAAAQRSSGHTPGFAGSAEGRHRSGYRESCEDAPQIDVADARIVNAAWRVLMPFDKDVLNMHYVWRAHSSFICRRLKLRQGRGFGHVWDFALHHAQSAIWKELTNSTGVVNPTDSAYNPRRLLIPA
ncbi:hypothetical protein GIY62_14715 [Burkholderia plantarii]|uniref:hypothetical protein n=1 Tax=Burkholderia plantarii TaxID=41899 RepID=UPI00272BFEB7|nr:hypothetical protein [Burkholderia plantarii]WLE58379.1 hypothetical protein GIY62_14715 [Burkholderia plantarii]